jgi:hypothetical protein
MISEVSRAAALVVARLGLAPGAVLDELHEAAAKASTIDALPQWAKNVLAFMEREEASSDTAGGKGPRPAAR